MEVVAEGPEVFCVEVTPRVEKAKGAANPKVVAVQHLSPVGRWSRLEAVPR